MLVFTFSFSAAIDVLRMTSLLATRNLLMAKHQKVFTEGKMDLIFEEKMHNLPNQSQYGAGQGCNRVLSIRALLYESIDLSLHH